MNKPNLARLYRRFTRSRSQPLPEVDALVALAEGDHSEQTERLLSDVARSGPHADLLRFARALQPESARLGAELERAFEAAAPRHRGGSRAPRIAAAPNRFVRVAASLAACLLVAVAVWTVQQSRIAPPAPVAAVKAVRPDRIFAGLGAEQRGPGRGSDAIFHGTFNGDRIFTGEFNGG